MSGLLVLWEAGREQWQAGAHARPQCVLPRSAVVLSAPVVPSWLTRLRCAVLCYAVPALQVAVPAKDAAYVKDDFFDQLSCDTLERLHLQEEGGE